jgi:hypothetical protein
MSNGGRDETFLARWSRQKRRAGEPKPEPAPRVEPAEPEVDLSKLPKIEDLTADSDITAFLQKGVPVALQRMALRRMWSLDPAIRDFIEVAENQWDFNAVGGVAGLFEEIAPDTDLTAWLAQAAPSLLPGDNTPQPAEIASNHPATQQTASAAGDMDSGAGADSGAKIGGGAGSAEISDSSLDAGPSSHVAESHGEVRQDPAAETAEPRPARRRHGGAQPR